MSVLKDARAFGEALDFGCGDNSCRYMRPSPGMHTNGGCRCEIAPLGAELKRFREREKWVQGLLSLAYGPLGSVNLPAGLRGALDAVRGFGPCSQRVAENNDTDDDSDKT